MPLTHHVLVACGESPHQLLALPHSLLELGQALPEGEQPPEVVRGRVSLYVGQQNLQSGLDDLKVPFEPPDSDIQSHQ